MKKVSVSSDQLDSSESYYKNIVLLDTIMIVPFVNLGIYDSRSGHVDYLSFTYVYMHGIKSLKLYEKGQVISREGIGSEHVFLGGSNLDANDFIDMDVMCDSFAIYMPDDVATSSSMWIPIDGTLLERNLDLARVADHFAYRDVVIY
jgi:hypothetical protein